ncbi:cyclin-dependent kinase inhibitor 1-like [Mangifera indica]|uniref:cyclin-dependent kinase inhibitor 1-like n=1 Tax=Mangifera indica TaxID=29780 RepID=UPI001CFB42E6|nr:cyclin-dependent kinase inhibitor 1-like [Mangifera indica]XP_044480303.1 cyclin-dependent kinase inhibitor 1-like [Mangifera indica]
MVRERIAEVAEIAVLEVAQVGVITAPAAEAMASATSRLAKKRKRNNEDLSISSSCIDLINRKITVKNCSSKTASESQNSSPNLDHDRVSTSCCSSNGSSEEVNGITKFADLEDESVDVETSTYHGCRERRESTPSCKVEAAVSESQDSTAKPSSEANSHHKSTLEKMPSESEIDEFFAEAEKKLLKQYSEKYNFEFVKEKPMEGRYEWVRLKP